jgi:glycosyltransferase involved in cell wall biosynthesis
MNRGLELASGDIVAFLNSDDFYYSGDVIENIVSVFKKNPELDLLYGDVLYVKAKDPNIPVRHFKANRFRPWKLRFGWIPPHPGTFIKRDLVKKLGYSGMTYKFQLIMSTS